MNPFWSIKVKLLDHMLHNFYLKKSRDCDLRNWNNFVSVQRNSVLGPAHAMSTISSFWNCKCETFTFLLIIRYLSISIINWGTYYFVVIHATSTRYNVYLQWKRKDLFPIYSYTILLFVLWYKIWGSIEEW